MRTETPTHRTDSWLVNLRTMLFGVLMGAADVVPGVSGGTVAIVVGVYERLVLALSRCDRHLWKLLREGNLRDAAKYIDLQFLLCLGAGIGSGVLILGGLMKTLLGEEYGLRSPTLAVFFGAILASAWIVGRNARLFSGTGSLGRMGVALLTALLAAAISFIPTLETEPGYLFLFFSGAIAICAMILPGVSGAYILVILGVYPHVSDALHALPRGEITLQMITMLVVLACGCLAGILLFSKLLRWLLSTAHNLTMAGLCGFIVGACGKVWPFQVDATPHISEWKLKQFTADWPPQQFSSLSIFAIVLVSLAAVLLLERLSGKRNETPSQAAESGRV